MPDFGTPFAGLDLDRKLSDEEMVRALRFVIAAEYEAIQLYHQIANASSNELVMDVMRSVADEEVVHAGEFLRVLEEIAPEESKQYEEGAKEVEDEFLKEKVASGAARISRIVRRIEADINDDPFEGVKLSSLYVKFETWLTKEIDKKPLSAPITVQMVKGLATVRKRLSGKMALTGRAAVEALVGAMKTDFTMDAAPFPYLMRKYGSDGVREVKQMWRGW